MAHLVGTPPHVGAGRRYYTEEPTPAPPTQPGNSQGSEAGDDEDSNGSTLMIIVVVGVVFLVCIMAALLVLSRPSDNTQHYRSDGPGAIVAFENPQCKLLPDCRLILARCWH